MMLRTITRAKTRRKHSVSTKWARIHSRKTRKREMKDSFAFVFDAVALISDVIGVFSPPSSSKAMEASGLTSGMGIAVVAVGDEDADEFEKGAAGRLSLTAAAALATSAALLSKASRMTTSVRLSKKKLPMPINAKKKMPAMTTPFASMSE